MMKCYTMTKAANSLGTCRLLIKNDILKGDDIMTKPILTKTPFERNIEKNIYKRLHEILHYDPNSGVFTWAVNGKRNAKYKIGDVAGAIHIDGYIVISFMSQSFSAHRLAWLYVYGEFPKNQIDHIDRDKQNNRINNLRDVSIAVNAQNTTRSDNTYTGIVGVICERFDKVWVASIMLNGKSIYLGHHKTLLNAAKARYRAEKKYKYLDDKMPSTSALYIESMKKKKK